jgi:hypothetical protein
MMLKGGPRDGQDPRPLHNAEILTINASSYRLRAYGDAHEGKR